MQFLLMILLAAAAASLSAPQPVNLRDWFNSDDVPFAAMQSGRLYLVGFSLVVSPTGEVVECLLDVKSGVREIDQRSCSRPLSRARFRPATSLNGQPSYGVYRTHAHWIVSGRPVDLPKVVVPTIDLKVNRLPDGIASPAIVRVMFAVDEGGQPSSCMEEPPHGPEPGAPQPRLAAIACGEIVRTFRATALKDRRGKAVSSVQDAIVRFTLN